MLLLLPNDNVITSTYNFRGGESAALPSLRLDQTYDIITKEVMMSNTKQEPSHEVFTTQEIALHMIASAARVLLMIGTAVLVGEVAAGPARRLMAARRQNHASGASADTAES